MIYYLKTNTKSNQSDYRIGIIHQMGPITLRFAQKTGNIYLEKLLMEK